MVDVGRVANVSAQTVSRYFTGTGYVSDAARTRIALAIEQLGYVHNRAARNFRAQRTDSIGVLAIGALNYGSSGILTGIGHAARAADVTVMIAQLDIPDDAEAGWEDEARRALHHFLSAGVDGVILSSPVPGVESLLHGWTANTPVIGASELQRLAGAPAATHSWSAALQATQHLLDLGHTRVLHVAGPKTRNEARERERGYLDAMARAGLEPLVVDISADWSSQSGHDAGHACDPQRFTAVFAANDEIALGFMSAMESRGLHAPVDYSIVGVDDMPTTAYFSPPLTTMHLDFAALGAAVFAEIRQEVLSGVRGGRLVADPWLHERESSAPLSTTSHRREAVESSEGAAPEVVVVTSARPDK